MDERVIKKLGLVNGCRITNERDSAAGRQVRVRPVPASWSGLIRWMTGMKVREGTKWNIFDKRVPYSIYPVAQNISEEQMYEFINKKYQ